MSEKKDCISYLICDNSLYTGTNIDCTSCTEYKQGEKAFTKKDLKKELGDDNGILQASLDATTKKCISLEKKISVSISAIESEIETIKNLKVNYPRRYQDQIRLLENLKKFLE